MQLLTIAAPAIFLFLTAGSLGTSSGTSVSDSLVGIVNVDSVVIVNCVANVNGVVNVINVVNVNRSVLSIVADIGIVGDSQVGSCVAVASGQPLEGLDM